MNDAYWRVVVDDRARKDLRRLDPPTGHACECSPTDQAGTSTRCAHTAATLLLERGVTPWHVAIQLGHTDGGQLVMPLYGHPSEAGARARLLAARDAQTGPTPIDRGGSRRELTG